MTSEGKCRLCGKTYKGSGMARHLGSELKKVADEKGKNTYFHIKVYAGPYFLHLLVKNSIQLQKLDYYLRNIWLECCGHMSEFQFPNEAPDWDDFDDFDPFKVPKKMQDKLKDKLYKDLEFTYIYDWGSSTQLVLKVMQEYKFPKKLDEIILLSRNEAFEFKCSQCKNDADYINTEAMYETDYPFFCENCNDTQEDFDSEMILNIVNSPRMGVCGYDNDSEPKYPFKLVKLN